MAYRGNDKPPVDTLRLKKDIRRDDKLAQAYHELEQADLKSPSGFGAKSRAKEDQYMNSVTAKTDTLNNARAGKIPATAGPSMRDRLRALKKKS